MQAVLRIGLLPEAAPDAAAGFHRDYVAAARAALDQADALAVVFADRRHDHAAWRKAIIADLAREAAPKRVNGVEGGNAAGVAATLDWLQGAGGITGQLLPVEGTNAGNSAE